MALQITDALYVERLGIPGKVTAQDIVTLVLANLGGGSGGALFPIWAEENGGIASGQYEWSWGNGATGENIGLVVPVACDLSYVTLNAESAGTSVVMETKRNGTTVANTTHLGANSSAPVVTPVRFNAGDRVSFRTGAVVGSYTDVRVCAWFREA